MKKIITLLLAIFAIVGSAVAQIKVNIYKGGDILYSLSVNEIDSIKFERQQPNYNGHAYVDLGLSVKWATCNVGATAPEEYGDYFAWGETTPKTTYDWSNYKYCNGDEYSMTKYCTDSYYGTVDNKTTLELSDDAARVNWGGSWRMPTYGELSELRNTNNCTWEWTTQNGVNGYKVTSKKNGNSIFLPAAGFRGSSGLCDVTTAGLYWSSSLSTSNGFDACILGFYSSGVDLVGNYRYVGQCVRPVSE